MHQRSEDRLYISLPEAFYTTKPYQAPGEVQVKIIVTTGEQLRLSFEGKENMEQSVILTRDCAEQLAELLRSEEGGFFETENAQDNDSPKP